MTRLGHPRPKSRSQYSGAVPVAAIRTGCMRFHRIAPIEGVAGRRNASRAVRFSAMRASDRSRPGEPAHDAKGLPMSTSSPANEFPTADPNRRDFLYIATAAVGTIGALATLVPLIGQMEPDASTLAAGGPVDLDMSRVVPGQQVIIRWRERPIFVFHRTPAILDAMRDKKMLALLADPDSEELQQPPYAQNWHRSINIEYTVLVGICTHLGCLPGYLPTPSATDPVANWPGGYLCPCHGSRYDLVGRVFQGVPAPYNLPVPPYHFPNPKTVRIGENPPGEAFDLTSVVQM